MKGKSVLILSIALFLSPAITKAQGEIYPAYSSMKNNPDSYQGVRIMFLPASENSAFKPEYYGGFTYSLENTHGSSSSNVYKAEKVSGGRISDFLYRFYNPKVESGYFTPASAVEGKVFTIQDIEDSGKPYLTITLMDENNTLVKFELGESLKVLPIMIVPCFDFYVESYKGKQVVHYASYSGEVIEYECTDVRLVDNDKINRKGSSSGETHWYSPAIILDRMDGEGVEVVDMEESVNSHNKVIKAPVTFEVIDKEDSYDKMLLPDYFTKDYYQECLDRKAADTATGRTDVRDKSEERRAGLTEKYGADMADTIINNFVKTGMTADMCLESWGQPDVISRSKDSQGVHEQWVYGQKSYLYFENGILTSTKLYDAQ